MVRLECQPKNAWQIAYVDCTHNFHTKGSDYNEKNNKNKVEKRSIHTLIQLPATYTFVNATRIPIKKHPE